MVEVKENAEMSRSWSTITHVSLQQHLTGVAAGGDGRYMFQRADGKQETDGRRLKLEHGNQHAVLDSNQSCRPG